MPEPLHQDEPRLEATHTASSMKWTEKAVILERPLVLEASCIQLSLEQQNLAGNRVTIRAPRMAKNWLLGFTWLWWKDIKPNAAMC